MLNETPRARLYVVTVGEGHSGSGRYEQSEREVLAYTAEDAKAQVEISFSHHLEINHCAYARVIAVRPACSPTWAKDLSR